MTSKQRILSTLKGEKCDRIAWIPGMNSYFVKRIVTVGKESDNNLALYVEACKKMGMDLFWGFAPVVEQKIHNVRIRQVKDGDSTEFIYETPKGKLSYRTVTCANAGTDFYTDFLIKGAQDYEIYRYIIENTEYLPCYEEAQKAQNIVGDHGLVGGSVPPTPIMGMAKWHMGPEKMIYELYDHEKELDDLLSLIHEKQKEFYKIAADSPAEIFRSGESTSSNIISPALFEKYCVPQLNDYAGIIHAAKKYYDTHMCGMLKALLPAISRINMDMIEPITPPTTGDTPLAEAKKKLPQKVVVGGIDSGIFVTYTPEKVKKYMIDLLTSLPDFRRCMLGTEEIPANAKIENVAAASLAVKKYGCYQ